MAPEKKPELLVAFPVAKSPPRLLRFFSSKGLNLLTHGFLKVTPPCEFNDPFEFCAAIPRTLPPEVDRMRWLTDVNGSLYTSFKQIHPDDYETWAALALKRGLDFWSKILRNACVGYSKAVSHVYGVCCFMELNDREFTEPDIVHFWDRYADCHRGFAVEFNPQSSLFHRYRKFKWLFPVDYRRDDQRSVINPDEQTTDLNSMLKYLRKIAAEKSGTWKTEHEWRMIASLQDSPKLRIKHSVAGQRILHFLDLWASANGGKPGDEIRSVYIGCRASTDLTESVLTACAQSHLRHVKVFEAKPSDHDYSFSYLQLR